MLLWLCIAVNVSGGQPTTQGFTESVWDGVFSSLQAARGRAVHTNICNTCHGVGGAASSTVFVGAPFWARWGEDGLQTFFDTIRNTMPGDSPGSLSDQEYLDVVAYILSMNGVPAGDRELTQDRVAAVRVQGEDGPGPVPNFSLVFVRGCLTEATGGGWLVTQGSLPVRTRNPYADANPPEGVPRGTATYRLLTMYPAPEPHKGHLVDVKGLLIRLPAETRLNVTSMQMRSVSGCAAESP